jgi:hypothetical protein
VLDNDADDITISETVLKISDIMFSLSLKVSSWSIRLHSKEGIKRLGLWPLIYMFHNRNL